MFFQCDQNISMTSIIMSFPRIRKLSPKSPLNRLSKSEITEETTIDNINAPTHNASLLRTILCHHMTPTPFGCQTWLSYKKCTYPRVLYQRR